MTTEHRRPDGGLSPYYSCARCGETGMNMYGSGHGVGLCEPNPELVKQVQAANPPRGVKPRYRVKG